MWIGRYGQSCSPNVSRGTYTTPNENRRNEWLALNENEHCSHWQLNWLSLSLRYQTTMRSTTLLATAFLAFSPSLLPTASAYTAGWQPGQAYTKYLTSTSGASMPLPTGLNGQPITIKESEPWKWSDLKDLANSKFGLEHILTHGPVSRVIEKFGFNVTAQLEMAREGIPPKFRNDIPLITDENYETFLLDEQYDSYEEEEERVWAIMW